MRMRSLAAAAALSLVAAQAAATPAVPSAAALSVQRAAAPADDASQLVGTTAWILAAIALGLIIWGIIELSDEDGPSSP